MKLFVFAVVCVASTFSELAKVIQDCGGGSSPVITINSGDVDPYPVQIPGELLASFDATVFTDASSRKWDLDVTFRTKTLGIWHGTPCIPSLLYNFGSCVYDACRLLDRAFKLTGCPPQLVASGIPCTCDTIKAGRYVMTRQKFVIPKPGFPFDWLTHGDYQLEGKLIDRTTGAQVGCLHVEGTLIDPPCSGFLCSIFG